MSCAQPDKTALTAHLKELVERLGELAAMTPHPSALDAPLRCLQSYALAWLDGRDVPLMTIVVTIAKIFELDVGGNLLPE
jgi:hypothetical protein